MRALEVWFLILPLMAGQLLAAEPELLPNGGAEEGPPGVAAGWRLDFWEPAGQPRSRGGLSATGYHSARSFHLSGTGPLSHGYWSYRDLPAQAGQRYLLTAQVRPQIATAPAGRCQLHIGFQNAAGEIIEDREHPFYQGWAWTALTGYSDWTPLGLETVAPPGTARCSVTLRLIGVGEVWFDDISLTSAPLPAPTTPPDLARSARIELPRNLAGACSLTLHLRNPYPRDITDLRVRVSGPGSTEGGSEPIGIAAGQEVALPVRLSLPRNLNAPDAGLLLEATYRLDGEARKASWLVQGSILPADLLEAIQSGRWGATDQAASGAAPIEVLGSLVGTAGSTDFIPARSPVPLGSADTALALVLRVNGSERVQGELGLEWECLDYFFRAAKGQQPVRLAPRTSSLLRLALPPPQVARLYGSGRMAGADRFRVIARLAGQQTQVELRLAPDLPAVPKLAPLAAAPIDLPPFGPLRLIDEVLCGDPADPHALREGGKGLSTKYTSEPLGYWGGGARLTYDWATEYRDQRESFSRVESILGRACRVAEDWGWFAYHLGRGGLEPGRQYVLAVDFPEDVSRNVLIWNGFDSGASIGFHTGSALGDPHTRQRFMQKVDLPLSGAYRTHTTIFTARAATAWIGVHSMGKRADPFATGAAVARLAIYELPEEMLAQAAPMAREPEGLPRRLLGYIAEDMEPAARNLAAYRFAGLNLYCPLTLSYGGGTYETNSGYVDWPSKLFGPEQVTNPMAVGKPGFYRIRRPSATEAVLMEAERTNTTVIPVLEYGGTAQLAPDALAQWPDGKPHHYHWGTTTGPDGRRVPRYVADGICLDMGHPAVGDDLVKLVTELANLYGRRFRSFGGLLLTPRFAAWQIGYQRSQLERFAAEAGLTLPAEGAGQWVAEHHEAAYRAWHYRQKRANLLRAAEALRNIRPDLRLVVLNYNAGDDNLHFGSPLYWWDKEQGDELLVPGAVSLPDLSRLDLRAMIEDYNRPDVRPLTVGMNPPLYRQDRGLLNLAPARYPFLCGNRDYLDHFRTAEGSAVCLWWIYNEDAYLNHPALGWNCPGLNGNEPAGRSALLDEVLAMAASDPVFLAVRIGAFNRGFPSYAREFAAAYRALPAIPSELVKASEDPEVVVRRYQAGGRTYLAVINTSLGPTDKLIRLDAAVLGGHEVTDLVDNQTIRGGKVIELSTPPVSLTALLLR